MHFRINIRGLFKRFSARDLVYLLIFPIFITLLMLLPEPVRQAMQLNIKNPQWWQFITSSFMHQNWKHLSNNLIGYFLFVFPLFFLVATRTNNKKKYYLFFIFILLTFPIFATIYQLHYLPTIFPNIKSNTGSSGVIAALIGLTPAFWLLCITSRNFAFKFRIRFAILNLSYILLAFGVIYFSIKNINTIVVLGLIFLFSLVFYARSIFFILIEIGKEARVNFISAFLMIIVPLFFLISPFIFLFPSISTFSQVAVQTGTGIDFYTHSFGVFYGMVISLVYFIVMDKDTKRFSKPSSHNA